MTNTTAIATAAPTCPIPSRIQDNEPVFYMDMKALHIDRYFLTIQYSDGANYGISLMVPRTGPARPRIEAWLIKNLPGCSLEDWYMQDLEKPGSFKGLIGLMTMRVA